jgi:hypothetical protein
MDDVLYGEHTMKHVPKTRTKSIIGVPQFYRDDDMSDLYGTYTRKPQISKKNRAGTPSMKQLDATMNNVLYSKF